MGGICSVYYTHSTYTRVFDDIKETIIFFLGGEEKKVVRDVAGVMAEMSLCNDCEIEYNKRRRGNNINKKDIIPLSHLTIFTYVSLFFLLSSYIFPTAAGFHLVAFVIIRPYFSFFVLIVTSFRCRWEYNACYGASAATAALLYHSRFIFFLCLWLLLCFLEYIYIWNYWFCLTCF